MDKTEPTDKYSNNPFFRELMNLYVPPEAKHCKHCLAITESARCPHCRRPSGIKEIKYDAK